MPKLRVTGSKVDLALACSYWAHETVELPPDRPVGPAAIRGTKFHEMAEQALKSEFKEVPEPVRRWADDFRFAVTYPPDQLIAERALAYNPFTGEGQVLRVVNREYPELGKDWLVGTADVVARDFRYVADHKTGPVGSVNLPQVNGQLALMALALHALGGSWESVVAEIHYCDEIGPEDWGLVHVTHHEFTPAELVVWRRELQRLLTEMQASKPPEPVPGGHCVAKYCPAYRVCPATQLTAAQLIPVHRLTQSPDPTLSAPQKLKYKLDTLEACKAILEEAERRVKLEAEATGDTIVDLEDGTTFQFVAGGERKYLDNQAVRRLLTPEQIKQVEFSRPNDGRWQRYGRRKDRSPKGK